jgi:hypothetical protein
MLAALTDLKAIYSNGCVDDEADEAWRTNDSNRPGFGLDG